MTLRHILVANVFFSPFSYGGATIVAEEVSKELLKQGNFRISAVSLCARSDLAPYHVIKCQKNGIENYLINVPAGRTYGQMYNNPDVTARLAELLSAIQPDLVHAHCVQEIGTGLITAANAAEIPLILSVHDFWWICERQFMIGLDENYCGQSPVRIDRCKGCVDNFWAAKLRFEHLNEMSSKAAIVTYPSEFAKDLCEASGLAPGRGMVWQNGVRLPDPSFFDRQADRRVKDKRLSFGFLGGPSQIKGWPLIKRAFSDLDASNLRGFVVEGSLDRSWWSANELAGMSGQWSIHPGFSQERMDDFYAEIDVLLFMSQWKETFGLAIREALARGIKVVQTDSGGTTEHPAIQQRELIPIGASSGVLRRRIEMLLAGEGVNQSPIKIAGFADQARALMGMMDNVIQPRVRAA